MEDFFKSVKSTDEALEMQQQLSEMLNLGGFHWTKWISNEKEVIARVPELERAALYVFQWIRGSVDSWSVKTAPRLYR